MIDLLCGNIIGHETTGDGHGAFSHVGDDFEEDETDGKTSSVKNSLPLDFLLPLDEATAVTGLTNGGSKSATGSRHRSAVNGRVRATSGTGSSTVKTRTTTMLTTKSRRKREQQSENLQIAITELLNHFSHRNLDAIVRVIKLTLEKLRKRITTSLNYGETKRSEIEAFCRFPGRNHREAPVFKVYAELAIPIVTIQPPTDEVQIYLNKAVQTIVSIAKNVSQWDKNRQRVSEKVRRKSKSRTVEMHVAKTNFPID